MQKCPHSLCAMDADFLIMRIVPDGFGVGDAFSPRFLRPFVHLVLILKEPIGAKNIAAGKGEG